MLEEKLKKGLKMIGEYAGDDDSGTETPLEWEGLIDPESLNLKVKKSTRECFVLICFLQFSFSFGKIVFALDSRVGCTIIIITNGNSTNTSFAWCS